MTNHLIIEGEEYVTFNEATKILKNENINLQRSLRFFKYRISKRSYIKKIDLDNLITFYKERKLLQKEKIIMVAQVNSRIKDKLKALKEKYGIPSDLDTMIINGEEYITSTLATESLGISSQKLNMLYMSRVKNYFKKDKHWFLKRDIEEIKKND